MKTLSKLITVSLALTALFFTTYVNAQTTPANAFRFDFGIDAGVPTGNLAISSNFVVGGAARMQYGLSNNFALTLTVGGDHFLSKTDPATGMPFASFGVLGARAGIKEFFVPHIYFGLEAGFAGEGTDTGVGNKKLLLSPQIGWANSKWDVGVRYDNYSGQDDPYGFVALRVAYGF
jgi:hypothetical protein